MGDGGLVRQAYRFALDPTTEQVELLASFTGASRFWFNQGLALVKKRLDQRAGGGDVRVPWSYERRGQISPAQGGRPSPPKREGPTGSTQARKGLAVAA